MYALAALLAGGAMLCAFYVLRFTSCESPQSAKRKTYLVGYVVLSVGALFSHFYTVGVLAVNAVALGIAALRSRDPRRMAEWVVAHGTIALVFGAWFFGLQSRYVARSAAGRSRVIPTTEDILTNIGRGLNGLIFGMRADGATNVVAIALFVVALLGVTGYWRVGRRANAWLIAGWVLVSLVVVLLTAAPSGIVNDFNPRYFLFALLPLALAAAGWGLKSGAWGLAGTQSPRPGFQSLLVIVVVLIPAALGLSALFDPSWAKSRYDALVSAVREQAKPGDGLVLVNSDQFPLLDYYGPPGAPTMIIPNGQLSDDTQGAVKQFEAFAQDKARVWLVNYGWAQSLQPRSVIEQRLSAAGARTYAQGFQDASLALYDLRAGGEDAPVQPRDVGFGGQIKLTGVRERTTQYQPGEAITLDLIWQAADKPKADYTVFMHLRRASDGGQIAAFDSQPVNGASPTSAWSAGQIITDTRAVPIPTDAQPGDYDIVIGWYQYPSFERLTLDGQDGAEYVVSHVTIGQP
jgi:hypothetical protein